MNVELERDWGRCFERVGLRINFLKAAMVVVSASSSQCRKADLVVVAPYWQQSNQIPRSSRPLNNRGALDEANQEVGFQHLQSSREP